MRRKVIVSFFLGVVIACLGAMTGLGCGETASIDLVDGAGTQDGSTTNESSSTTADGGDGGGDGVDGATNGDGSTSLDGGSLDGAIDAAECAACQPDFCGCGQCTRDQIVCTKTPSFCPLACATSCDLSNVKCGCLQDRCVSITPAPDNVPCYTTADCPPGKCCIKSALERRGVCQVGTNCQ